MSSLAAGIGARTRAAWWLAGTQCAAVQNSTGQAPQLKVLAMGDLVDLLSRVPLEHGRVPQELTHHVRKRQATHALAVALPRRTTAECHRRVRARAQAPHAIGVAPRSAVGARM